VSREKKAISIPERKSAYSKPTYTEKPEFLQSALLFSSTAAAGPFSGTESDQAALSGRLQRGITAKNPHH